MAFGNTRAMLEEHMRECDRRSLATDRKLDKIETKVEMACQKFDDVAHRISKGVTERHEENQRKIDGLVTKLDALPWTLLKAAIGLLTALAGVLLGIFRAKVGL